jgi:hypothetical protein
MHHLHYKGVDICQDHCQVYNIVIIVILKLKFLPKTQKQNINTWTHGNINFQSSIHILYSCQVPKYDCIYNFVIHKQAYINKIYKHGVGNIHAHSNCCNLGTSPYLWMSSGLQQTFCPLCNMIVVTRMTFKPIATFIYFVKLTQKKQNAPQIATKFKKY